MSRSDFTSRFGFSQIDLLSNVLVGRLDETKGDIACPLIIYEKTD